MPFGLKCAGSSYQRAIDKILAPHQEYSAGYIDDISVFSQEWKTHLIHLHNFLTEFQNSGMTMKLKKCFFGRRQVQFLRHMVGSGCMSVVQGKVDAIKAMPEPSTKKLLKGFLGMCGYYRTFLPGFSDIASPLTDMTKGGKTGKVQFTETQREAFNNLKIFVCDSTQLYAPVYHRPFNIQCDASDYAVKCCLSQLDDNNTERPLAFASSKLSDTQRRWSTIEKEAYAVLYALK